MLRPTGLGVLLGLALTGARRFHDESKHKHAHTYLSFCSNEQNVWPSACIHKVSAKWPTPAQFDAEAECKESSPPHNAVGTANSDCTTGTNVDLYEPITINQGLRSPTTDYKRGADVDTLTDWDRIRCRDGQLFATGCAEPATASPHCMPPAATPRLPLPARALFTS